MADDKRTKIGTGPASVHDVPTHPTAVLPDPPPHAAQTSYLPAPAGGDPLLGQTLAGRYQIVKKLGEGGMGAVYLATHNVLEKQVALKVLHGEFARKPDLIERFMQEAKAASRIRHENVIDISDFGVTPEGIVFFAMELLHGHDLHEDVARARLAGQLLPWSRSKKIFLQICAALAAAHARGIIHRDLKPENVYLVEFLGDPDFVKLLDFGIAKLTEVNEGDRKLTRTGMLFGTPEYMSPEQARGEQVDHRVDVYAMGCILFQLVTGRVPFEAENFMGVLSLHLTEPPPMIPVEVFDRIGAPRELAAVIERALAKDRNQRWASIEDFANAIRTVCGDPIPSATGTVPQQRAASVPAPERTTTPAVAIPNPTPAPGSRQRTQWTGNLSVPHEEGAETEGPRARRSRTPLYLGLAALAIGGAVAAVLVVKSGDKAANAETGGPGSAGSAAALVPPPIDAGAAIATVTPDAAPVLPPVPEQVTIKVDSKPRGAELKDVATGRVLGKTPVTFKLRGSHDPRQFALHLRGYSDIVVELVPNREKIEHTEKLERGSGSSVSRVGEPKPSGPTPRLDAVPADAGAPAVPTTTPDAAPANKKPDPTPPPPPIDDDCEDPPCLKTNVPGLRGSAGIDVGAP